MSLKLARYIISFTAFFALSDVAHTFEKGNVIFFHPDGTGVNHWGAVRMLKVGPDGKLNWDKLPHMAVYTGHMKNALTSTSHGGATSHAYGVKVQANSYGMDGTRELTAASGRKMSIMQEALLAGVAVGVVQSGHIAEPGTGAFLASVPSRRKKREIAKQVINSGAMVIMSGGERYLLPKGVKGRHGKGTREDSLNLIKRAKELGYTIVYNRDELNALDLTKVNRLLGVFASGHTFNDQPEEKNKIEGKANYIKDAPTIAEMIKAALAILSRSRQGFFLVAEEEATDNMANHNNASGQMEALKRADEAIGVLRDHVAENQKTLVVMAADSEAGGLQVLGPSPKNNHISSRKKLPARDSNGAPLDGIDGAGSLPFISAPDKAGRRWPFAISWGTTSDSSGGILVRGEGLNSKLIRGTMDNTDIYRLMYLTLFGRVIEK